MRAAVIQSCYIPWRGFFDLIGRCDVYVIFDSAQFVKRHWHNRNRIKTAQGVEWLTIPVISKGRFEQPIDEVEIRELWADRHWRALELAYGRAPYFRDYRDTIQGWYERAARQRLLTAVNELFLRELAALLRLDTCIIRDSEHLGGGRKTERLVGIVQSLGADTYLSGPSARAYLDEALFARAGIAVEWMSYGGYEPYPQLHGAFEPEVTLLDVIFNTGLRAPQLVRSPLLSKSSTC
ncbi:MAG: WbqC family protein [Reyranella sp.]|nr:WbqC family protein [Reyranella sp.]